MLQVVTTVGGLVIGAVIGFLYRKTIAASDAHSIESQAQKTLLEAQQEAARTLKQGLEDAKAQAAVVRREAEEDVRARRDEIARIERRITDAEEDIRAKNAGVAIRTGEMDEREERLTYVREQLERATELHRAQLEKIAGMTSSEAREVLVVQVLDEAKRHAMSQVREIEQRAREEGEERARKIVTIAIQRVASEQTAESTVSVFALPSEDMKGRIIGREGRNIRAFEATTGVNIIIDDTPEAVVLSSFDPVRREAARMTLEKLKAA